MEFELGAPVCAWMAFQLMKGVWKFKFVHLWACFKNLV
jgi:hypothetical protein